jgi:hypothetical protein
MQNKYSNGAIIQNVTSFWNHRFIEVSVQIFRGVPSSSDSPFCTLVTARSVSTLILLHSFCIRVFSASVVCRRSVYTVDVKWPHINPRGDRSGDLGGHSYGPRRQIHFPDILESSHSRVTKANVQEPQPAEMRNVDALQVAYRLSKALRLHSALQRMFPQTH